jgi:hypothetical protein
MEFYEWFLIMHKADLGLQKFYGQMKQHSRQIKEAIDTTVFIGVIKTHIGQLKSFVFQEGLSGQKFGQKVCLGLYSSKAL